MKAKFSKCHFWWDEVRFLGHIVLEDGLAIDLVKVAVVQDWQTPKNVTDIRSFLDLAGYYRKFIKHFARISDPLTCLTKKNSAFVWDVKCEDAFGRLKEALTIVPILVLPDGTKPF